MRKRERAISTFDNKSKMIQTFTINFNFKVIQRRDDFGEPRENFNRDWGDYKNGFGDPAKEFWLGNENIYMLTNNEDYILRVELEDFEGNKRYMHKICRFIIII